MAVTYIDLNQAAKMLGVSPDELNNMRLGGDIYGVRDGSSWKFKADEIERVAEERGISLGAAADADADLDLDLGAELGEGTSDLQLDLEAEDVGDSPTAIGRGGEAVVRSVEEGSDLQLAESGIAKTAPKAGGKPVAQASGASDLEFDLDSESDIRLVPDESGSEVNLVAGSSDDVLGGSDVGFQGGAAGTGDLDLAGSDLGLSSDVSLEEGPPPAAKKTPDSNAADSDVTIGQSEEISLDEDDGLVLDGGSDITRGAGDTGINLTSPSDSGLNLEEEPLDLAGSSVSSLELPEDEDLLDLEDLEAEPEAAAPVQADEDFQLAPSAALQEDEEDSGSQVIALEDSSAFAVPGEGLLEEGEEGLAGEPIEGAEGDELVGDDLVGTEAAPVTLPSAQLSAAQDIPYSIWNVLSLLAITVVLAVTGMLMTDLVRNMWTWDETYSASTPIMDVMVRMFGLRP